jgi:hypothetical protein
MVVDCIRDGSAWQNQAIATATYAGALSSKACARRETTTPARAEEFFTPKGRLKSSNLAVLMRPKGAGKETSGYFGEDPQGGISL